MKRIYRYPLRHIDNQSIPMPLDAEILSVQRREGTEDRFDLWALVEPDAALFGRVIWIVGTGQEVPHGARFIDTVQVASGEFVFHVFEGVSA